MVTPTSAETREIIRRIDRELARFAAKYDEDKYPPDQLAAFRRLFRRPADVTEVDIEAALKWKYGHTGKARYPRRQRALVARIAKLWRVNPIVPGRPPEPILDYWRSVLGSTSFITVCFLLHLANPKELPILDQHNFRSVNRHLARVRPGMAKKAKPSQFQDLILVRDFGRAVRRDWNRFSTVARPSVDVLDRYLMMHGKALKTAARRRTV
jgi:hypothetical protein